MKLKGQKKRKPWHKAPSWFKTMNQRKRRAKEKDALRHEREIPTFRHTDHWDWT